MRTIEIATSQNVTIRFELASTGQRIAAFILDLCVIFLYIWLISVLVEFYFFENIILGFIISIPVFFYSLFMEYLFNGSTPGKLIVGIKVMKMDGSETELIDYFGRWSTRLIDLYLSGGAIALILVSTSTSGQRIGDILSGTVIVRTKTTSRFNLKDILGIQSADDYDALYPEIRQFSEDDMVLIKRLVDRYDEYPNAANRLLIRQTSLKVIDRLNIKSKPKPDEAFLKSLIKDYVILSR